MKSTCILIFTFFVILCPLFGQAAGSSGAGRNADLVRGEEYFMQNKPAEALPFLQSAFLADQRNIQGAMYLAMVYEMLNQLDEAIAIYRIILPTAAERTDQIAFNLGNIYFRTGNAILAEQFYTQAININPGLAPAWLNRANLRIRTGALHDALPDYEYYLVLHPSSPQRPQIERLINMIRQEAAAAEMRRIIEEEFARQEAAAAELRRQEEAEIARQALAAAELRRQAEEEAARQELIAAELRRQAEEEAAREAAERLRRLMEELAASLQAQAEEAEGIGVGAEALTGYTGEFELE